MTAGRPKVRLVRGLRLVSTLPGYWKLESDPRVLFQFIGKARLGPAGARYSVDRWLSPDGEVSTSLDGAVKHYLARKSSATKKVVTITVHEDSDEETDEETYTISDDGGEFDDVEEESAPDVQGDIDERRLHYRSLSLPVLLDAPAGRGWR